MAHDPLEGTPPRHGSERRGMIVVGIIALGCLVAALVAIVSLGRADVLAALPAPTTAVMLLVGFVLFISARRQIDG